MRIRPLPTAQRDNHPRVPTHKCLYRIMRNACGMGSMFGVQFFIQRGSTRALHRSVLFFLFEHDVHDHANTDFSQAISIPPQVSGDPSIHLLFIWHCVDTVVYLWKSTGTSRREEIPLTTNSRMVARYNLSRILFQLRLWFQRAMVRIRQSVLWDATLQQKSTRDYRTFASKAWSTKRGARRQPDSFWATNDGCYGLKKVGENPHISWF